MMCKVLYIVLINFLTSSSAREQWIDPHDMTPKIPTASRQSLNTNFAPTLPNKITKCDCKNADDTLYVHYRRTLSILLKVLQVDHVDSQYKALITVNMPMEDYNFLQNFVENSVEDITQLRKVNSILDSVFTKTLLQKSSDSFLAWLQWLYFTFYNHTTGIAIAAVFISWFSYKLLRLKWTAWRVVKTLVLFAWIIDFAFTWIHLIQEEEIDKVTNSLKYSSIPAACDPNNMNWWQYTWSIFSRNNDCRQYHATMLQNAFWKVSPFTVFAHQFGIVIATPANNIGKAIGSIVSGMMQPLPFGVNYLLLPILLLFFLLAACILLSFFTNTSFQINVLHMINLKIGDKQRHMIGNLLSIPVQIEQESIESVRNQTSKQKRVKEKEHCSDVQSSIENVVRIEDVSKEHNAELNDDDDKKEKMPPISNISDSAAAEIVQMDEKDKNEIRQRFHEIEKKVTEESDVNSKVYTY